MTKNLYQLKEQPDDDKDFDFTELSYLLRADELHEPPIGYAEFIERLSESYEG